MAQRAKRDTSVCCAIAHPTTQMEIATAITTAMERKKPNQDSVWVVVIAHSSGLAVVMCLQTVASAQVHPNQEVLLCLFLRVHKATG